MGGKALSEGLTRRHNKDEYLGKVKKIIHTMVWENENTSSVAEIQPYTTKETFGDADIIYSTWDDTPFSVEDVRKMFPDSKEIKRNTSVISFEFEELQVDLIWSNGDSIEYATKYFSFNDLGNLMGKVFHSFGLKHGHAGLTMPVRDGNHGLGDVTITLDFDEALRFAGYDPARFAEGFDTLEDVFKYARSTPFFNAESYKLENLNAVGRIRDKKRSTYNSFLAYNLENPVQYPYVSNSDKSVYLESIFNSFPDALPEYRAMTQELAAQRYLKSRFNGEIVKYLTGLEGKELGEFMQVLKKNFILQNHTIPVISDDKIRDIIMAEFVNFGD